MAKKIIYGRLREGVKAQGFISSSYIGEVEEEICTGEMVVLSKVCAVYEVLVVGKDPKTGNQAMDIQTKFFSDSSISNGALRFNSDDFLFFRNVDSDDELLNSYHQAMEAFRLDRAGLQRVKQSPIVGV